MVFYNPIKQFISRQFKAAAAAEKIQDEE